MDKALLTSISIEELRELFQESVSTVLQKSFIEKKTETANQVSDWLSRKETAKLLGISLPTLGTWTKKGIIKGYRINTNIRYKKDELEKSLIAIKTVG